MPSAAAGGGARQTQRYHPIGITFHWVMALCVFVQLGLGWRTTSLEAGYQKLEAYAVHALLGLIILTLAFLRAGWRLIAPLILPELENPEDLPGWQKRAAEATHFALYALMFALPLSGWAMLSAAGPVKLPFGLVAPPAPFIGGTFIERAQFEQAAESAHLLMVFLMMALIALHVGAALKHHFIDKDDVLSRMIPWLQKEERRHGGAK